VRKVSSMELSFAAIRTQKVRWRRQPSKRRSAHERLMSPNGRDTQPDRSPDDIAQH
jgi:hypothetical protein